MTTMETIRKFNPDVVSQHYFAGKGEGYALAMFEVHNNVNGTRAIALFKDESITVWPIMKEEEAVAVFHESVRQIQDVC